MQAVSGVSADLFGLYELSDDGTILYSRSRSEDGLREPTSEVIGRDFFHDIARFDNSADLRRHFRRFISGDRPVDTFAFDCLFETQIVRAKIFMTRAFETNDDHAGEIVIMDIRRAGQ